MREFHKQNLKQTPYWFTLFVVKELEEWSTAENHANYQYIPEQSQLAVLPEETDNSPGSAHPAQNSP